MSKSMIEAFTRGQYKALGAKDNKERLRFTIAGCKDGKLYDHVGTNYGTFDTDAPDTEFITESDFELQRITGAKIASITNKMQKFFEEYGSNPTHTDVAEVTEDEIKDSSTKELEGLTDDELDEVVIEIDFSAVEKECKKAIKKGNFKKAEKLIGRLPEDLKLTKKLQKKLEKAR